jgi:DnaJ-like protein
MMSDVMALKIAVDLVHLPSQVRLFRSEPLPDGVPMLIRIVGGDNEAESTAVVLTGRSGDVVRRAASFFIEQILFAPNADSYRVLGVSPLASSVELRRNVALLLRWLHPDLGSRDDRSIFIGRVTAAWNDLKTPERRAAYDNLLRLSNESGKSRLRGGKLRPGQRGANKQSGSPYRNRRIGGASITGGASKIGFLRRALSVLFDLPLQ